MSLVEFFVRCQKGFFCFFTGNCKLLSELQKTLESHESPETLETPETPFRYHFGSGMGMYLAVNEFGAVDRCPKFLLNTVSKCMS